MTFASPWFLVSLLPWLALAAWCFVGRRRRLEVPFIHLWRGPIRPKRVERAFRPPPAFVLLVLLALLAAALAAGGPVLTGTRGGGDEPRVTVLLDRGLTMSGRGRSGPRYAELMARVAPHLRAAFGPGRQRFLSVPGDYALVADPADAPAWAASLPPSNLDARAALSAAIYDALTRSAGPVVVLTDRELPLRDDRLLRLAPETPLRNAGIEHVAVRERPSPQLMVRIRNDSAVGPLALRISTDAGAAAPVEVPVELPAPGTRNVFLDLPSLGRTLTIELLGGDDLPADDRAYLAREQRWPKVEARSPLPAEVRRVIEVYREHRPAGEGSPTVTVTMAGAPVAAGEAAVIVALPPPGDAPASRPAAAAPAEVAVTAHPVTAELPDLPGLLAGAALGPEPAEAAAWTPLIVVGGRTAVAVREAPARQVHVALAVESLAARPEFVVLWTNMLDWAGGGGGEAFVGHPLAEHDPSWRSVGHVASSGAPGPGIYERGGQRWAFNVTPLPAPAEAGSADPAAALSDLASRGAKVRSDGGRPLRGPLLALATALLAGAAFLWPRRPAAAPAEAPHAPVPGRRESA